MKQIATIATTAILLALTLIPMSVAAQGPSMFGMFCSAVQRNLAQGPQSSSCFGPLQQGLQNQQTGNNPQTCPTGFVLQGIQCVPVNNLNSALNPLANTAANTNTNTNPTVQTCTPTTTTLTQPISVVGPNQVVSASSVVTLIGTSSTGGSTQTVCPSGLVGSTTTTTQATIVSYLWNQISGPAVALNGANTATPTFTAPATNSTALTFSLVVTDSANLQSAPVTTVVTVS